MRISRKRHEWADSRAGAGNWAAAALLTLALAAPLPLVAQEPDGLPAAVSLGQLLRIARERSPRYAVARTRVETAQAEVVGAGVLPNPRFTYGAYQLSSKRNTMFEGRTQENLLMEVPVLIAGQREARVEAAEKAVEATAAGVEAEFAGLFREAAGIFLRLQAGRERVAILDEAAADMAYLRSLVAGREEAGSASPYDLMRIGVETRGVETRVQNTRTELVATSAELGNLLGLKGWRPEALGPLASLGVAAEPERLWKAAEERNPDLEAMRRAGEAAEAGLEQARRERWPVPTLQVGAAYTDRPYGMTPYAGVSVEVPIFNRGQGGMARAEAEKQAVQTEASLVAARTRAEIERAAELLERRRATRLDYERDVLARLPDLKQMAEASYRFGQGSLLELLDASRSRTEIRLAHLDMRLAEAEAELDALKAAGLLIGAVDRPASPDITAWSVAPLNGRKPSVRPFR
jgi:cobalt-zinc-cadmium efflux system outer membrane protein